MYWDPYQVVFNTKSNISWSPTTSLAHELGHLVRYDRAVHGGMGKLDEFLQSTLSGSDEQFETLEERIIITTTEQYAARRHGDILSEQVTRSNHEGVPVPAPQEGWQSMSPEEISRYVYYILNLNDIK